MAADERKLWIESTRDPDHEGVCLLTWGAHQWYAPVADVRETALDLMTYTWDHPSADLHALLRDAADDTLTVGWSDDFEDAADTAYTSSPDGLRELAAALNASCQWDINPDYMESQVLHEQEHATAALAAGFTKIRYGLLVRRERTDTPGGGYTVKTGWRMMINHVAPRGPVTKLAYASIVGRPDEALRRRRAGAAGHGVQGRDGCGMQDPRPEKRAGNVRPLRHRHERPVHRPVPSRGKRRARHARPAADSGGL